jgi:hypothetical protein
MNGFDGKRTRMEKYSGLQRVQKKTELRKAAKSSDPEKNQNRKNTLIQERTKIGKTEKNRIKKYPDPENLQDRKNRP